VQKKQAWESSADALALALALQRRSLGPINSSPLSKNTVWKKQSI
jgi:hypothetical protein